MYKNIIFDVDGTLINTTDVNMKGLQYALYFEKMDYQIEELYQYDGLPSLNTLEKMHVKNIDRVNAVWHDYVEKHTSEFTVYYGIQSLIELLSKKYNLAIVTSRNKAEIHYDPQLKKLLPYFDSITCYDDTSNHKPHPEPLIHAMSHNNYSEHETIYVGDSLYDYQAASDANITFFKAVWGNKDFEIITPHQQLKSPFDLLLFLQ